MRPGAVQHRATRKTVKATASRRATRDLDRFSLMHASELGRDEETALSTELRNFFKPIYSQNSLTAEQTMASYKKLPELTDNEHTLLIKFIEFADKNELTRVDARNIHTNSKEFGIRPLILRATFQNLCNKSVLTLYREHNENVSQDPYYYEINPDFADDISAYFEFMTSTAKTKSPPLDIPAADRFVSIGDNQPILEATKEALSLLSDAVRGSNELFASAEERVQVSKEIDYVRELISKPRIHVIAVWDAAKSNRNLKWLIEQGVSGIIREAAVKAFEHLDKLIHFISSL